MPPNDKTDCVLTDRKTGKAAGPQEGFWQKGEVDVTGKLSSPPGTGEDYAAARDAAILLAKQRCAETFSCTGKCRDKDSFCVGDVEVVEDRSGRVESRQVDVPDTPYGGPAHKETRRYVTYEVRVRCKCGCAKRPVNIRPGSGGTVEVPGTYAYPTFDLKPWDFGLRLEFGKGTATATEAPPPAESGRKGR